MVRTAALLLFASCLFAQDTEDPKPDQKVTQKPTQKHRQKLDVGAVLRKSKPFAEQCKKLRISFADGEVRVEGEIAYRGGGPCEYLVAIYPAKSHETVVLLDDGPWKGEGRRDRATLKGYAQVLNNAFLAAGFKRGTPFDWDDETGEVFPPSGEAVQIYVEWEHVEDEKEDENGDAKDADAKAGSAPKKEHRRAQLSDWLWNFKTVHVMESNFVYTGSLLIEHDGKTFLGAELDGLILAVLNTATALLDSLEDGSLDNGAYEAIPKRIPKTGTRVKLVFSRKKLTNITTFEPLKLNDELKKSRAAYLEKKAADDKLQTPQKGRGQTRQNNTPKDETEKPSK